MPLKRTTPDLTNSKTLITGLSKSFLDIDLAFMPKVGTVIDGVRKGDIYKKKDAAAVLQSVRNILLTNYYEKPFNMGYGGNIRSMLFETKENYSESVMRKRIMDVLKEEEPRAIVEDVTFFDDDGFRIRRGVQTVMEWVVNDITIKVDFRLETDGELFTASVNMSRLR